LKAAFWLWIALLLAACNLVANPNVTPGSDSSTPEAIPSATEIIPQGATPTSGSSNDVPVIGAPNLEPSGAGPCVVTPVGNQNISIHNAPGDNAPVVAMLGVGLGEIPFEFREGWYSISWYSGTQEIIGWLQESAIQLEGMCDYLKPPAICSVESAVGRNVDIYAEPRRDTAMIGVLGDLYTLPFVERSADGWFGVEAGNGQTGWIAPDEGRLVGC
jgi:hypothetical protein